MQTTDYVPTRREMREWAKRIVVACPDASWQMLEEMRERLFPDLIVRVTWKCEHSAHGQGRDPRYSHNRTSGPGAMFGRGYARRPVDN